jgi:hypothetical protein
MARVATTPYDIWKKKEDKEGNKKRTTGRPKKKASRSKVRPGHETTTRGHCLMIESAPEHRQYLVKFVLR